MPPKQPLTDICCVAGLPQTKRTHSKTRPEQHAGVIRAFPSYTRSILTKIYLCHACSCHEIEDKRPDRIPLVVGIAAPSRVVERVAGWRGRRPDRSARTARRGFHRATRPRLPLRSERNGDGVALTRPGQQCLLRRAATRARRWTKVFSAAMARIKTTPIATVRVARSPCATRLIKRVKTPRHDPWRPHAAALSRHRRLSVPQAWMSRAAQLTRAQLTWGSPPHPPAERPQTSRDQPPRQQQRRACHPGPGWKRRWKKALETSPRRSVGWRATPASTSPQV
jgi:hypothetical protein